MNSVKNIWDSVRAVYYFSGCVKYRPLEDVFAACCQTCVVISVTVCARNIRSNMTFFFRCPLLEVILVDANLKLLEGCKDCARC